MIDNSIEKIFMVLFLYLKLSMDYRDLAANIFRMQNDVVDF
ncbi:hypothetical protein AQ765_14495 [Burkholderia pseudomallei]|nr:hypothetical protein AQ733_05995 [Burkholderia pseudomallei]OMS04035.1 hypothetical protein AQ735_23715 [Burkholderia pseudomallei]OMS17275.1 hypothetical protein AQ736_23370 [Burkholderia pseudomallei]OMT70879.1 hypothetical protein AQ764_09065 [Burkholderia pseudomallei]OMT98836.1 hypothetical protein AQ765_14495 [Burkholderia pseudomallei]